MQSVMFWILNMICLFNRIVQLLEKAEVLSSSEEPYENLDVMPSRLVHFIVDGKGAHLLLLGL